MRKFVRSQNAEGLKNLEANLRRVARKRKDEDAIHDLRVSIRRLRQQLTVFAPWFPSAAIKKIRQLLRRLMKYCGEVRNCDIAIDVLRMADCADPELESRLYLQRRNKRKRLMEEIEIWRKKDRIGRWRDRLKLPQRRPQASAGATAARLLPGMVEELFREGRTAARPGSSFHTMHRVRLKVKAVRYSVELFSRIYGKEINRMVKSLKGLQEKLGAINDCATTLDMVRANRPAAAAVRRLARKRQADFRGYWKKHLKRRAKVEWVAALKAADRKT